MAKVMSRALKDCLLKGPKGTGKNTKFVSKPKKSGVKKITVKK